MISTEIKKTVSLMLALLTASSAFASCGNDPDEVTDSPAPVNEAEIEETGEETVDFQSLSFVERMKYTSAGIDDGLPEKDYEGRTFVIYGITDNAAEWPDEITGEPVNDAKVAQLRTIEERFNIDLIPEKRMSGDWDTELKNVDSLFMAGDPSSMELYCIWNTSAAGLTAKRYFLDMSDLTYMDLEKPWFFRDEMLSYGYGGKYWLATGFMDTAAIFNWAGSVFFNKNLATDLQTEDFYEVVKEGRWTLDYFTKTVEGKYTDLNGNGVVDDEDMFGVVAPLREMSIYILPCLEADQLYIEDGQPKLSVAEKLEQVEPIWNKLRDLMKGPDAKYGDWDVPVSFMNGNTLFLMRSLNGLNEMRDKEFEVGILPVYKADEAQENYYLNYLPNPYAIPHFAPDPELSSIILTALAAEGYKQVLTAVYEVTLKTKYSSDEKSGEMLDIMMRNVRSEPMFMYGNSSYIYNLSDYISSSTAEFASYWKSKSKVTQKEAEKMVKSFEELVNQ